MQIKIKSSLYKVKEKNTLNTKSEKSACNH